jgi:AraC family transcriptional regulator of adaptative response/methylated-DNA-[protein]-cysteine methyltransferase
LNLSLITTRIQTPLGPMVAAASDVGVCLLEFEHRRALPTELRDLERLLGASPREGDHPHLRTLAHELEAYFTGPVVAADASAPDFAVPLHAPGTPFQRAAWAALRAIPRGETRTYAQQAHAIGRPHAVRAIARANGQNRISIVIPCHRVIGSDGTLTGYGGGLENKRWLLAHEGTMPTLPLAAGYRAGIAP